MIVATFPDDNETYSVVTDMVWQYDYGQVLQIEGITVDDITELDFAPAANADRVEIYDPEKISEKVMQVAIPDELLINDDIRRDYSIYVWVFVISGDSGETTHQVRIPVLTRPARQKEAE